MSGPTPQSQATEAQPPERQPAELPPTEPRWGIVLVHGVRTSATMWRRQVPTLEAAGHDVVAVDLPGHGTRMAQPFTLEAADATIQGASERLRAAGVARIAVVGLSLGGYLSLRWAVRTETPPEALVLSSCTARPGGLGNRGFVGVTHAFRALPGDGAARVSVPWARAWVGAEGAQDIVAGGVGVEGQLGALRAMMTTRPVEDLGVVVSRGIPVTFVLGEWDHFRLDETAFRRAGRAAAAAAGTPPPRWVLVRRAHHLVSLHRPRAYTRAVLGALGAQRSDR
ncbi:alpha/beta hydrolase [Salana multivorans]